MRLHEKIEMGIVDRLDRIVDKIGAYRNSQSEPALPARDRQTRMTINTYLGHHARFYGPAALELSGDDQGSRTVVRCSNSSPDNDPFWQCIHCGWSRREEPGGGPARTCWMPTCFLWDKEDTAEDGHGQNRCGERAVKRVAAVIERLVEEIANRRVQRAGKDEHRPKHEDPAHFRADIQASQNRQQVSEDQRRAGIAEPARIRRPFAERSAERLQEGDRDPVEQFRLRLMHRVDRDRSERAMPQREQAEHASSSSADPPV